MQLLVLGDVHGHISWFEYAVNWAKYRRLSDILQVGDLMYYTHQAWGRDFMYHANLALKEANMKCYFIDGNHENFDILLSHKHRDDDGFIVIPNYEQFRYIPRGHRWEWEGIRYLGFGGAFSVDKEDNVQGVGWWPQELPTYADVSKALEAGKVDIMLTHDAPAGLRWDRPFIPQYDDICQGTRNSIRAIVDECKPELLFHGHYHTRYKAKIEHPDGSETLVRGLGMQGNYGSLFPLVTSSPQPDKPDNSDS